MIDSHLRQHIQSQVGEKKWYRRLAQRASVCLILSEIEGELSFLMMQRALYKGDPWSGQMSFPGGKQDYDDNNITETAFRESSEELGIANNHIERIGRLSDILARPYRPLKKPMVVSPLIFQQLDNFTPTPNNEVADWLWLPVSHFRNKGNRQSMVIEKAGLNHELPCYDYKDKRVWGLSLLMIDELITLLDKSNLAKVEV